MELSQLPPIPIPAMIAAGLIAGLLLALEHYAAVPYWRSLFRQDMPPLVRYIIGGLALYLPTTWVLVSFGYGAVIIAIWIVAIIGGGFVGACYGADRLVVVWSLWHDKRHAHKTN